jgi:hypothetical protein
MSSADEGEEPVVPSTDERVAEFEEKAGPISGSDAPAP